MTDRRNYRQDGNGSGGGPPRQRETIDVLAQCPALRAYVDRVTGDGVTAEVRNFRRIVLTEPTASGRYRRDGVVISIAVDGAITVKFAPAEFAPTEAEAEAIRNEFTGLELPKSIPASPSGSDKQRRALGVDRDHWFEFFDRARTGIVMCQQRVDKENGDKEYFPWTFWSDGQWRRMEPDGDGLPMWKPKEDRLMPAIMVHEGAKKARYVDWLVNDTSPEARETRARHPWAVDLARYEHWGWIGGAPNPHRSNWSELSSVPDLGEITIVTDNDLGGKAAISHISRALKSVRVPVWEVRFDDAFRPTFGLDEPFPEAFWVKGRYRGPSMTDCRRSATWATRLLPPRSGSGGKTNQFAARAEFVAHWLVSITPAVYVHRSDPGTLLSDTQFNARAAVLGREGHGGGDEARGGSPGRRRSLRAGTKRRHRHDRRLSVHQHVDADAGRAAKG